MNGAWEAHISSGRGACATEGADGSAGGARQAAAVVEVKVSFSPLRELEAGQRRAPIDAASQPARRIPDVTATAPHWHSDAPESFRPTNRPLAC